MVEDGFAGAIEGQIAEDLEFDSDYNYFLQSSSAAELLNNMSTNTHQVVGNDSFCCTLGKYLDHTCSAVWSYSQKIEKYVEMRYENMGVCYKSGFADYAEYLECIK